MIFFTSDSHFGHTNIIKYTNRPFASVGDMDDALVDNWNSVVSPKDTVYHLGDFCLGKFKQAKGYFSRLNGRIRVLSYPWHHDRIWLRVAGNEPLYSKSGQRVELEPPVVVMKTKDYSDSSRSKPIVLSHYPFAVWDRKHYGSWHLHGHSHGNHKASGMVMDVGVDCTEFYPVSLHDVSVHMRLKPFSEGR